MNNYFFSCFVANNICEVMCYNSKKKYVGKAYNVDYDLMKNIISVINEVNLPLNVKCKLPNGIEFYYKKYGEEDEEINIYIYTDTLSRIVNLY